MEEQNSQEGNNGDLAVEKKGNFSQVPNEMLERAMNRKEFPLTGREYAIVLFLVRELNGWRYEYKPIEISDYVQATGIDKQNLIPALASLIEQWRLVKKVKLPGFRTPLYGFNKETLGRTLADEPRRFYEGKGKVINLMTFKVLNSMPLEVIESMTEKRQIAAVGASERASKHTSNTHKHNLREIEEFLKPQRKQTRNRWEGIINGILEKFPKDEELLWKAIELVSRTGQDLFGRPIRRSIIGLFEGDWVVMRVAMQAKLAQIDELAIKEKKREQNQKMLEASNQSPIQDTIKVDELSPQWQRFAGMKSCK